MSILSGIIGGGGGGLIGGLISSGLDMCKMAFPQLQMASALNNLMGGAIGDAVKGAVDQICKDLGMPKFIGDIVKGAVDEALGQNKQHCGNDVSDFLGGKLGKAFEDFSKGLMKDIVDAFQQYKKEGGGDGKGDGKGGANGAEGGGKGGKSWFVALMQALGEVQNQQAAKLEKLSKEVSDVLGAGNDSAGSQKAQFDKMEEFKAESKLQEVLANVTKSIGDAIGNSISTVARAQ
ncbi:hypothetical protein [Azohydromonas caseinilytica]|uniref:Uncharacterized protein n=1 Tax=Azohydromonas caseinilytica TaxID=2728836 RepID=A0A848FJT7_9BURK|nr:hypothetical protein [Azohydromonas caseinilytica]NML18503.1 hypothetical protein [Azohydromonas caseinilytica]